MIVGVLLVQLFIPESKSLKDKRRHIKSIKDRLRSKFNVSVSEVDSQELWQRGSLGIVVAGSDASHIKESLHKLGNFIEKNWPELVLEIRQEILTINL